MSICVARGWSAKAAKMVSTSSNAARGTPADVASASIRASHPAIGKVGQCRARRNGKQDRNVPGLESGCHKGRHSARLQRFGHFCPVLFGQQFWQCGVRHHQETGIGCQALLQGGLVFVGHFKQHKICRFDHVTYALQRGVKAGVGKVHGANQVQRLVIARGPPVIALGKRGVGQRGLQACLFLGAEGGTQIVAGTGSECWVRHCQKAKERQQAGEHLGILSGRGA